MRRFLTVLVVAAVTALGTLYWLHDGDMDAAIAPVVSDWNADQLARDAGVGDEG